MAIEESIMVDTYLKDSRLQFAKAVLEGKTKGYSFYRQRSFPGCITMLDFSNEMLDGSSSIESMIPELETYAKSLTDTLDNINSIIKELK